MADDEFANPEDTSGQERQMERRVTAALQALLRAIRTHVTEHGLDTAAMDRDLPEWRAVVRSEIMPSIEDVFGQGFRRALNDPGFSDDPYVSKHLFEVENRLVRTADQVFDVMRDEIDAGRREGEDVPTLTARVQQALSMNGAPDWRGRARTIARTETISAYNAGHLAGTTQIADLLGIDASEIAKRWLATDDERTRHTHNIADDQVVLGLATPFLVGGFPMQHPGDPAGPPQEVINCRCTLLFLFPGDPGHPVQAVGTGTVLHGDAVQQAYNAGFADWTPGMKTALADCAGLPPLQQSAECRELRAWDLYQGDFFTSINGALRTPDDPKWADTEAPEVIANLDQFFSHGALRTEQPMEVVRGIRAVPGVWDPKDVFKPGSVVAEPGYLSVSADVSTAIDYATQQGTAGWVMRITMPKGTPYVYGVKGLSEFVVQRGRRMRVLARDLETRTIYAEVLP